MTKKIVMDPQDFAKITENLNELLVPFTQLEKAIQIKEALKRAQFMDIEIQPPKRETIGQDKFDK